MKIKNKSMITYVGILIFFILSIVIVINISDKKIDTKALEANLQVINDECNKIFSDIDGSEEKYIKLLETEEDPFKRGTYSSALVQVYTAKNNYDKVVYYGKSAVDNYNKVEGGAYYAIAEQEYLAWSMYNMGEYLKSFIAADTLLEMLNENGEGILTEENTEEAEALIYSIFLRIYTKFDILDKAEIYYDKLCEMEIKDNFKVTYSLMEYAIKIDDKNLRKNYAEEYYQIILALDIETGNNVSDSAILHLGVANIEIGEYEEAIDQIQRAEKVYSSMDDYMNLASAYTAYAQYYEAVGKTDLVLDYYNKAIEIYSEYENYEYLQPTVASAIEFIKKNNIQTDIYYYCEIDYMAKEKVSEDKTLNELLSHIISVNSNLNNSKITFLEKAIKRNTIIIVLATIVIGLLIILIRRNNKNKKILENLANIDYVTGINNRAKGEKLIVDAINKNHHLSIALLDIDNFKNINDKYGHIYGDYILREFSKHLKMEIGENDIVFRFGGEEFVIVFVNENKENAKKILDKIRLTVNEIVFENNVKIAFSAGVVQWNETSIDLVIKEADELMYRAKKQGKNRVL